MSIARFRPPPPGILQRISKTLMSSKPRRKRLTADLPARALDLLCCFQWDRHDDHMARTAAFFVPIAQPQKIHDAMKMVAAPVHTPRSLSISGASNAFSESITGDRFMLLMDLDFQLPLEGPIEATRFRLVLRRIVRMRWARGAGSAHRNV